MSKQESKSVNSRGSKNQLGINNTQDDYANLESQKSLGQNLNLSMQASEQLKGTKKVNKKVSTDGSPNNRDSSFKATDHKSKRKVSIQLGDHIMINGS